MSRTDAIRAKFEEVVAEMKVTGTWDIVRPSDEAFENMGAFGMNTMAYEQWLRWVLVPTIESRLDSDGPWPPSSSVGAQAFREFDGMDTLASLTTLLCEFDQLF